MTKGDVFDSDEDRMKCMCQITQSLSTVIPPMHGFQMPIIYLPKEARSGRAKSINQIEELSEMISRKYRIKAQGILSNFKKDIGTVEESIGILEEDWKKIQSRKRPIEFMLTMVYLLIVMCTLTIVFGLCN